MPEGLVQDEAECGLRSEETRGPKYHRGVPVLLPNVVFDLDSLFPARMGGKSILELETRGYSVSDTGIGYTMEEGVGVV